MKQILIALAVMLTTNLTAQNLYSDAVIKKIRARYSTINQWVSETQADAFVFIDGSAYIGEKGDTIYEGEGEERKISVYKRNNKIIRITDTYASYEGEARTRSIEYNLFNDTLIFVFTWQNTQSYVPADDKGFYLNKSEDRIYFHQLKPYFHLTRSYSGYTGDLNDFSAIPQTETGTYFDSDYIDTLNEIKTNYLNNNMKVYHRVIERLE